MGLLDAATEGDGVWHRIGAAYEITKKPRDLDLTSVKDIPFSAMEAIPQDGSYSPGFTPRTPDAIASGTYFERGDLLVAKITPSFENGKQALAFDIPAPFGYATTEVIPLRPRDDRHDPRFLFFYLLHPDIRHYVAERMEGSTGRQRVPEGVLLDLPVPVFDRGDQTAIADLLEFVQRAKVVEQRCELNTQCLKAAAVRELFRRGLRGQVQKETEIGLLPERWYVGRLDRHANVVSTRMTYSELEAASEPEGGNRLRVLGVKVADMNRPGNEVALREAELEKMLPAAIVEQRCAPPDTIIFPKRGAAIATNKKRLSTEWTVFDPNVIGVIARDKIDQSFLFHWFQGFDLREITEPGPTPQLNKKNLEPLMIPIPPSLDEQREIAGILDAVDRKIDVHRRKKAVLEELFRTLLHELMTGQIPVADLDLRALGDGAGA